MLVAIALMLSFFQSSTSQAVTSKSVSFQAEVWADNWFELYINGKKVGQDSVPITTERSFNSEKIKFSATYPLTVGVVAKDFTQNASGLEYIGKSNQQIGDGGFILQIREVVSGKIIGYSTNKWKVLTINTAPTNASCEKSNNPLTDCQHKDVAIPKNWSTYAFKDSSWKYASLYTKEEVGVKEGYFDISWNAKAALIWSSDLKLDNVLLLRSIIKNSTSMNLSEKSVSTTDFSLSIPASDSQSKLPVSATCDGAGLAPEIKWSNSPSGTKYFAVIMDSIPGPPRPGESATENHYYLLNYNIPASVNSIPEGNKNIGTLGRNFLGKNMGYTPPCSQGPGLKTYTVTLYALTEKLDLLPISATESSLIQAMSGKVIKSTKIDLTYERSS